MGLLVDGVWQDEQHAQRTPAGRFVRPATRFRNWITEDGSAGASGEGGFPAARDRYHLYVSLACPCAHRTVIKAQAQARGDLSISVVGNRSTARMAGGSGPARAPFPTA
jgi:putative glutathione S-transferase